MELCAAPCTGGLSVGSAQVVCTPGYSAEEHITAVTPDGAVVVQGTGSIAARKSAAAIAAAATAAAAVAAKAAAAAASAAVLCGAPI